MNSIYFCIFNNVAEDGLKALEEIHARAVIHLYTDVLLVNIFYLIIFNCITKHYSNYCKTLLLSFEKMTNAIRNSLQVNPSGGPCDGPMGISIALSPTSNTLTTTGISKTAITNASFKTRKLPDDIPIVTSSAANAQHLGPINEENEDIEKTIKGAMKGMTAGIGKMGVIQLLKERKEKKKGDRKIKYRPENGSVITGNQMLHDNSGNDEGSDTSGISDSKTSYSEETIPLKTMGNKGKSYVDDENESDSSSNNSGDFAEVPLVNSELSQHPVVNHNEASVNV